MLHILVTSSEDCICSTQGSGSAPPLQAPVQHQHKLGQIPFKWDSSGFGTKSFKENHKAYPGVQMFNHSSVMAETNLTLRLWKWHLISILTAEPHTDRSKSYSESGQRKSILVPETARDAAEMCRAACMVITCHTITYNSHSLSEDTEPVIAEHRAANSHPHPGFQLKQGLDKPPDQRSGRLDFIEPRFDLCST